MWFYGIYLIIKNQVFTSLITGHGLLPVDRKVDCCRSRSTGPIDRRAQACMLAWACGPVDRAVDHPESSALWKWPRSTGRELYPVLVDRAVNRAVDRRHNGHKNDRWLVNRAVGWSTGRLAGQPGGRPEGHFWPFLAANGQNFCGL